MAALVPKGMVALTPTTSTQECQQQRVETLIYIQMHSSSSPSLQHREKILLDHDLFASVDVDAGRSGLGFVSSTSDVEPQIAVDA